MSEGSRVIFLKLVGLALAAFVGVGIVDVLGLGLGPALVVGFACGYLVNAIWYELLGL